MKQRIIFSLFSLAMIFLVSVACQKDYESILDPTSKTVMTSDVKASEESSSNKRRCNCPSIEDPVCGINGITYRNACFANCADVRYTDCSPCICSHVYAPVCGDDGITYTNSCYADCEGVHYRQGHCDLWITE